MGVPQGRILVVDDSASVRHMLDDLLTRNGYVVTQACDGEDALKKVGDQPLNFILTDIEMPGMDGYCFIRHLAAGGGKIPSIVVMSGRGDAIINTAAALANAYGLPLLGALAKPICAEQLIPLLREVSSHQTQGKDGEFTTLLTEPAFMAGLAGDALTTAYQPKVRCQDGCVDGVECLARWKTKDHGILGPNTFLPVASRKGYMPTMTHRLLDLAGEHWASWRERGVSVNMAVNISSHDVRNLSLIDDVKKMLTDYGMPAHALTLELVESEFLEDMASSLEVLGRLRLLGVNLALDDFGAGFDPFVRLTNIPFSEIKVDKTFVNADSANKTASSILELAVRLAQRLDIDSVCEGIETKEQWQSVCCLGATSGQGYYLARPQECGSLGDMLREWEPEALIA